MECASMQANKFAVHPHHTYLGVGGVMMRLIALMAVMSRVVRVGQPLELLIIKYILQC